MESSSSNANLPSNLGGEVASARVSAAPAAAAPGARAATPHAAEAMKKALHARCHIGSSIVRPLRVPLKASVAKAPTHQLDSDGAGLLVGLVYYKQR